MRVLIAILVAVYLVGVGVELAPTIEANWNSDTASQFFASVTAEMPRALSWPATVYRRAAERAPLLSRGGDRCSRSSQPTR
jgi:hypothetical protein